MSLFRQSALGLATILTFVSSCFPGFSIGLLPADEKQPPNIVWLISEDNSKHYLDLFDQHGVSTPNIRELAKTGLTFQRAFSNAPVCSVARTTLITGCYAHRIGGHYHRKMKPAPLPVGVTMFPALLRNFGYHTSNRAKKDYNVVEPDGVWDESSRRATWKSRKDGQPFFHCRTIMATHESTMHYPRAAMLQKLNNDPAVSYVPPLYPNNEIMRHAVAKYCDAVQEVDKKIGNVIKQLKRQGLLENTFIFYFGDHGGVLPRSKGFVYETGLHIPLVIRIPENHRHLVGADYRTGSNVEEFVSFVDFAPTVLKLAGVDLPKGLDGMPFLGPEIDLDPTNEQRKTTFGNCDRCDEKYDLVRSIRVGPFKYIRNFQPFLDDAIHNEYRYKMLPLSELEHQFLRGELDDVQAQFFRPKPVEALFNVEEDPFETSNLASHPEFQTQLIKLRDQLTSHLKELPDLGFVPESVFLRDGLANPTSYGQKNKALIGEMIDTANLALRAPKTITNEIKTALRSPNPWIRYWAINACLSSYPLADEAILSEELKAIQKSDSESLNRVMAATWLAINQVADPQSTFELAVKRSESKAEVAIILNFVVLLNDRHDQKIHIEESWCSSWNRTEKDNIRRRLSYLNNRSPVENELFKNDDAERGK